MFTRRGWLFCLARRAYFCVRYSWWARFEHCYKWREKPLPCSRSCPAISGETLGLVTARLCSFITLLLSERERCLCRTLMTDCCFRAHFNLWWARHGWPLIHLVSRRDSLFSRPPYFTAGVNLTAEPSSEPPRGGEHGAGATCLNKKTPFAESRNEYRL